jgi:DNA ligase D-like protein (predicted 3'-phosphoesterase)
VKSHEARRSFRIVDPDEEAVLGLDPEVALRGWERPVYMVHDHHSQRHHFDLRLEFDGVLKSWAVPKGLAEEQGVKRLAMEVDDHALSYAPFEGTIPEGSYGAGKVDIWDRGTFQVLERADGKYTLQIRGKRIRGTYHLVRTTMGDSGKNWLVFRKDWSEAKQREAKLALSKPKK